MTTAGDYEVTQNRSIKIIGLVMVAALALSALAATQASATEYIYKVGGKELTTGEMKEIRASLKKEFTIRLKGTLGIEAVIKCKKVKLNAAAIPKIVGGKPGKSEKEKFEFEECTATLGGAKCSSVEVAGALMSNEVTTVAKPASLKGRRVILFTPSSGRELFHINLVKCGTFGNQKAVVIDSFAALVEAEGKEEVKNSLVFATGESEITEVEKSNGEKVKSGLETEEKNKATLEGEIWIELVSGEIWGVF